MEQQQCGLMTSDSPDAASQQLYQRIRIKAMSLLAGRELSEAQLRQKLQACCAEAASADLLAQVVAQVVEEFRGQGWQNDARAAEAVWRAAQRQHWGPLRTRQVLQERGLASEVPEACTEITWVEAAIALLNRRYGACTSPVTPADQARMLRYLAGRGYTGGQCHAAFKRWTQASV